MRLVAVSDPNIAKIIMGQSPPSASYNLKGDGLPFFQGKTDFGDLFPTTRIFCNEPKKIAEPGDILISVRAPVGPTNLNPCRSCIGRGVAAIRCLQDVDSMYLLYFLRYYEPNLARIGEGSTFEAINRDDLEDIPLPLPSLPEQKRIATILEKADWLRRLRRYTHELSDTYLRSVFLKMFYHDVSNSWPRATISSLRKSGKNVIRTGPFGSQLLHSEFVENGIAVLGIDNAAENRFVWGEKRFINEKKYQQLRRYTVFSDDVIITIMGTTGRCAIIPQNFPLAISTKHLCCITLNQEKCLPIYLQACFLNHPEVLQQLGVSEHGAVMPGLNMEIIKNIIITVPPISQQKKFTRIVQRFEHLQSQQREAERQAEHLFQTLLHRAFRGQLTAE